MSKRSTHKFGTATVSTRSASGEWTSFMVLPVKHAAELAESLRTQGRSARVVF